MHWAVCNGSGNSSGKTMVWAWLVAGQTGHTDTVGCELSCCQGDEYSAPSASHLETGSATHACVVPGLRGHSLRGRERRGQQGLVKPGPESDGPNSQQCCCYKGKALPDAEVAAVVSVIKRRVMRTAFEKLLDALVVRMAARVQDSMLYKRSTNISMRCSGAPHLLCPGLKYLCGRAFGRRFALTAKKWASRRARHPRFGCSCAGPPALKANP